MLKSDSMAAQIKPFGVFFVDYYVTNSSKPLSVIQFHFYFVRLETVHHDQSQRDVKVSLNSNIVLASLAAGVFLDFTSGF